MLNSYNPRTNELISSYIPLKSSEVNEKITLAHKAYLDWKNQALSLKSELLIKLHDALLNQKHELSIICHLEMGKNLSEAEAEIDKCALTCKYYADNLPHFLNDESVKTEAFESYIQYAPLGVVLGIMPWNYPFWQVIRFAVPAISAGNAVLLKHASNVSGCALFLEQIFIRAGYPSHLFQALLMDSSEVKNVIENPLIQVISFTGSTRAGKLVGEACGKNLKKVVLELGGSDAYLVLKDADLNHAAKTLVRGRFLNSGMSCISPKRILIDKSIYPKLIHLIKEEIQNIKDLAPLPRFDLRMELHEQVTKTIQEGAKCLVGGFIPSGEGFFYPATLLVDVTSSMCAFKEEIFGPVMSLTTFENLQEGIDLFNQSEFGLGGGIFSKDLMTAKKIVNSIDSGSVFINDFVKSDPRLPFGGIKNSGYGRELSIFGIREFVNIKTVVVK